MIIQAILVAIYDIFDFLLVFSLPKLPTEVAGFINNIFDYMVAGAGVLANYTPLSYLMTLFGVLLAVDAGLAIYHFVMWVIKKIPMLGVS